MITMLFSEKIREDIKNNLDSNVLANVPSHLENWLFDQVGVALDRRVGVRIFNDYEGYQTWIEDRTHTTDLDDENSDLSKSSSQDCDNRHKASRKVVKIIEGLKLEVDDLLDIGFARVGRVSEPGEFSLYGDVLILWPHGWVNPLRISVFGDEVESIEVVSKDNYKGLEEISSLTLTKELDEAVENGVVDYYVGNQSADLESDKEFAYLRTGGSLIQDLATYDLSINGLPVGSSVAFSDRSLPRLVDLYKKQNYDFYYVNSSFKDEKQVKSDLENLKEGFSASVKLISKASDLGEDLTVFTKGFMSEKLGFIVLTPYELYGEINLTGEEILGSDVPAIESFTQISRDKAFKMISPGDYVVHEDHGVGLYRGLKEMNDDVYFELAYSGKDRLFVPTSQAAKITKYVGAGRKQPILTALNNGSWRRIKAKADEDADALAKELVQLYAMRSVIEPTVSLKDHEKEIEEFIDSFPYKDTPDQISTTYEVLMDLKSTIPMDRLLVGDVGFGKTEVAIRAMYATVLAKGQVALLAPTTILVEQHASVIRKRLKGKGVSVVALSRFLKVREAREIVKRLEGGDIDIIVGTHALLSENIKFNNLGLIVIDEEQKFGVTHKEKLKQKRVQAHVLSMSATPIPRTLNLSLTGIRDISIISTPPSGRFPVKNRFKKFSWEDAVDALQKELDRGGQAYFLHNRVANIDAIRKKLAGLMPSAQIEVAHGQMKPEDLSFIMKQFADGEIDILVCTTIIENGIDLPNVNTLVVNDAQRFGLSQLYQIRGRVGRSTKQGYAYFFYNSLVGNSSERLDALAQSEKLGSGFNLSSRDLEIRGAGNILGKAQSGSIDTVGYGLYMSMLQDKLQEYKSQLS